MIRINQELSDRLAQRMWVDPGDEDFGRCFFNARRALFRITRLRLVDEAVYTEGFAIYYSYNLDLHCVAAHGWVTHNDQVIDIDYADRCRYDAVYFPGLHLPVEEVYYRLKASSPPGAQTAFGLVPMGVDMTKAYVQACECLHTTWPEEVTPHGREHLSQWRDNLAILTRRA